MGNNLVSKFRTMISTEETKVSTRQYFYVHFSPENVNDDVRDSAGNAKKAKDGFDFLKYPFNNPNDFGMWVQNMNLPNLNLDSDGEVTVKNNRGIAKMPGDNILVPSENTVTISFLETEEPIIENVFVPWLQRVAEVPKEGSTYPFLRSKIYIDLLRSDNPHTDNKILTYILHGAYPSFVTLPELTQASKSDVTRDVTFTFNSLSILPGTILKKTTPAFSTSTSEPQERREDGESVSNILIERALKKGKEVLDNRDNIF